ncbi:MAG: hypothetical protein M1835_004150 [Candelina submexicana]|nr:MAG: hypothetical protein M1835_004150 [Candelina submexicana]
MHNGIRLELANKQTKEPKILCVGHSLFSPVSTNFEQNLFLQHSEFTDHAHTMQEPATAMWGLSISDTDLEKLKVGFEPQDWDDKWHVWTNESQTGTISIHFARSKTLREFYILVVKLSDGSSSGSDAKIEAIIWEQNKGGIRMSEEQAKKEAVITSRRLLGCEINALPEYDVTDIWNHPGALLNIS